AEHDSSASICRACGARLGAYARPAPTVPDEPAKASPAVERVLARSSGAPLLMRAVFDAIRAGIAFTVTAIASPVVQARINGSLGRVFGLSAMPFAKGAVALLIAMATTLLTFRITSRRFARPLRGASP